MGCWAIDFNILWVITIECEEEVWYRRVTLWRQRQMNVFYGLRGHITYITLLRYLDFVKHHARYHCWIHMLDFIWR